MYCEHKDVFPKESIRIEIIFATHDTDERLEFTSCE